MDCQQLRFQTNPDLGGVEKITISAPRREYNLASPFEMEPGDVGPHCTDMLAPHGLIFVKGWSRCLAALTIGLCCYQDEGFLEALCACVFECRIPTAVFQNNAGCNAVQGLAHEDASQMVSCLRREVQQSGKHLISVVVLC